MAVGRLIPPATGSAYHAQRRQQGLIAQAQAQGPSAADVEQALSEALNFEG